MFFCKTFILLLSSLLYHLPFVTLRTYFHIFLAFYILTCHFTYMQNSIHFFYLKMISYFFAVFILKCFLKRLFISLCLLMVTVVSCGSCFRLQFQQQIPNWPCFLTGSFINQTKIISWTLVMQYCLTLIILW